MKIILADHLIPISSPPLTRGGVAIERSQILSVGGEEELKKRFPAADIEDFGVAAIIPGLVNCHSHLELTAFRGALDDVEEHFAKWLLKINELRSGLSNQEIADFARNGALEGASAGVTCFGDIGRNAEAGIAALKDTGLRGIVYQETQFSPDNRTAEDDFKALAARFEGHLTEATDLVKIGLSPHSPYTVGSQLFELIAQYSIINRIPLSIHAAESVHEDELLFKGTGLFRGFYERFDLEWESPGCSPIEYLERLGVLSARPLLAHCLRASDRDIERIASNGASVAHCPKSNAKFGHGYAPFEKFLDAGISVGLGSDSVASNNVCDLLEESRFAALAARNRPDWKRFISANEVLEAATLGGARALGLDEKIGTLEPGKEADLAVVKLNGPAQEPIHDPCAAVVFSSNARDVCLTMVAGKEVYRDGDLRSVDKL